MSPEEALYHQYKSSIFKVISEHRQGTGFLVDSHGLILTNQNIVAQSDYLSITINAGDKFSARLLAEDQAKDLATMISQTHADILRPTGSRH